VQYHLSGLGVLAPGFGGERRTWSHLVIVCIGMKLLNIAESCQRTMCPALDAKSTVIKKLFNCLCWSIDVEYRFQIPSIVADNSCSIDLVAGVIFDKYSETLHEWLAIWKFDSNQVQKIQGLANRQIKAIKYSLVIGKTLSDQTQSLVPESVWLFCSRWHAERIIHDRAISRDDRRGKIISIAIHFFSENSWHIHRDKLHSHIKWTKSIFSEECNQ
jgi:hypothetical protein